MHFQKGLDYRRGSELGRRRRTASGGVRSGPVSLTLSSFHALSAIRMSAGGIDLSLWLRGLGLDARELNG